MAGAEGPKVEPKPKLRRFKFHGRGDRGGFEAVVTIDTNTGQFAGILTAGPSGVADILGDRVDKTIRFTQLFREIRQSGDAPPRNYFLTKDKRGSWKTPERFRRTQNNGWATVVVEADGFSLMSGSEFGQLTAEVGQLIAQRRKTVKSR